MNRLIIIGNGFDLAHGLKTSVRDFNIHYFTEVFNGIIAHGDFEDDLIKVTSKSNKYKGLSKISNLSDFENFKNKFDRENFYEQKYNIGLLRKMYADIDNQKWLNVEFEYFMGLNEILESANVEPEYEIRNRIVYYNELFEKIKNNFLQYLKKENKIPDSSFVKGIYNSFISDRVVKQLPFKKAFNIGTIDNILFLNFNYTSTLDLYSNMVKKKYNTELIHIHGDLDEKFGKPIFGYGDELNKKYLTYEELNQNELYKHIKSFYYSLNSNYHKLTSFLDSIDYEVYIYGHSCGITDRTLLNQIFEHNNCKLIKVFYHQRPDGTNDFVEKSYEIARHFNDKIKFRKRLIPLDKSMPMPQNN